MKLMPLFRPVNKLPSRSWKTLITLLSYTPSFPDNCWVNVSFPSKIRHPPEIILIASPLGLMLSTRKISLFVRVRRKTRRAEGFHRSSSSPSDHPAGQSAGHSSAQISSKLACFRLIIHFRLPAAAFEDKKDSVAVVRPIAPVHIFSDSTSHWRPWSSWNVHCDTQGDVRPIRRRWRMPQYF